MPPRNSLIALPQLLSLLFLPPTILLFWNLALITTLLSGLVLLFRVLKVYLDVGTAILAERWRSPPGRAYHVRGSSSPSSSGGGGGGKEGLRNESISRLERRGGGSLQGVDDMVLPVGRVNYATLIRPLEPVSEWRVRRGGDSGYPDSDLNGGKVREEEEGWGWNGWEGVASR